MGVCALNHELHTEGCLCGLQLPDTLQGLTQRMAVSGYSCGSIASRTDPPAIMFFIHYDSYRNAINNNNAVIDFPWIAI